MMDEVYNRFKKDIASLHKRGYKMNYPNMTSFYDKEQNEIGMHIELAMFKKAKLEATKYGNGEIINFGDI